MYIRYVYVCVCACLLAYMCAQAKNLQCNRACLEKSKNLLIIEMTSLKANLFQS